MPATAEQGRGRQCGVGRGTPAVAAPLPRVETPDYAAMMRRMICAHGRRAAVGDVEDLTDLIELRELLDEQIAYAVRCSREHSGRSWADIARATNTTRQNAHQRWGSEAGS
ncbi:MAG: hypothetical protein WKF96_00045 [Solirubrobacteraceae bacterium]